MATKKTRYTVSEAAKKLGVTRAAVYSAIEKRQLRTVWGTVKVKMIPAASLKSYQVDQAQQERGKKN